MVSIWPAMRYSPCTRSNIVAEIDKYFHALIEQDGSDLHLSAGRSPNIRKDGDITGLSDMPVLSNDDIFRLIDEIMPERNKQEFKETNDSDFAYEIPNFVRLRANVRTDHRGVGGVFRVIPSEVITAEQLNLPEGITNLCYLSKGLVVVTGPTGSGKSTTLAGMIDLINKTRSDHIITIEDPIEFVHVDQKCLITQREVHAHTESFSKALRAALRQDPDIVMVGEMRDLETMETAIETAETGHLVFGTLHTNTAASTIDRIIDSFPGGRQNQIRSMLANSLKASVSQTLCKRKQGGRVAAMEVMIVDHGISSLIREGKIHQVPSAMQVGGGKGMSVMSDSLAALVQQDIVDPDEAYLKAVDKEGFVEKLRKLDLPLPEAIMGPEDDVSAEAAAVKKKKGMFRK
jgi:twitching motility protein PilT